MSTKVVHDLSMEKPPAKFFLNNVKNPAAETAGRPLFECVLIAVIPASEARRESVLWKGKQPIPDKPE